MDKLLEQLESNTYALKHLERRYNTILNSKYYIVFYNHKDEQIKDLEWILKIRRRVLSMRFRILENINLEATKEMQRTSSMLKGLNLKAA